MKLMLNLSDTELIERLHNGQEAAFEILFHRYKQDVRNVVVHYVRDKSVTEDLCQDAFLKIYTSLKRDKYNEQGNFVAWALRIVRNLCLDYLRKPAPLLSISGDLQDNCLCTTPNQSADSRLTAKQQGQQLSVFINCLPDEQKKVVYYRYFEELSFKEISALMNTSVNTSLGRMRYGLATLRRRVASTPAFAWR